MTAGSTRAIVALLFAAALAGAVAEVGGRLEEIAQWRRGPAELRDELLYGPYRDLFSEAGSRLSPDDSVLLLSVWDPALVPYYLHPRKIYQLDVEPETNHDFMMLPPSQYPRRLPESFAVDWVVTLRDRDGVPVPVFRETARP